MVISSRSAHLLFSELTRLVGENQNHCTLGSRPQLRFGGTQITAIHTPNIAPDLIAGTSGVCCFQLPVQTALGSIFLCGHSAYLGQLKSRIFVFLTKFVFSSSKDWNQSWQWANLSLIEWSIAHLYVYTKFSGWGLYNTNQKWAVLFSHEPCLNHFNSISLPSCV